MESLLHKSGHSRKKELWLQENSLNVSEVFDTELKSHMISERTKVVKL